MASYFDVQPPSKATAEVVDLPGLQDGEIGHTGLLSPQVTRMLDDLEDHSSSDDEELSPDTQSDDESGRKQKKDKESLHKTKSSPQPQKIKKADPAPPPRPGRGPGKHPHMARFHSLRSVLFQAHIEDKMAECKDDQGQTEAEGKWKAEHDQRGRKNRPKTPESPNGSPTKEGFRHRLGNQLRRMASKDVKEMPTLREDADESSTSDADVHSGAFETGKKWDEDHVSDDESINHSDVEDLVRWASRRDPPSDDEGRRGRQLNKESTTKPLGAQDSGHGSLAHDDVEDLVRWLSRKEGNTEEPPQQSSHKEVRAEKAQQQPSDSDASTASDSESEGRTQEGSDDEDLDELVRWISRREGSKAGSSKGNTQTQASSQTGSNAHDASTSELLSWVRRTDETSGESDVDGIKSTQNRSEEERQDSGQKVGAIASSQESKEPDDGLLKLKKDQDEQKHGSLAPEDVDDLVRWVSQKQR